MAVNFNMLKSKKNIAIILIAIILTGLAIAGTVTFLTTKGTSSAAGSNEVDTSNTISEEPVSKENEETPQNIDTNLEENDENLLSKVFGYFFDS
jgi:flagellar basal body-associated protein FliL